MKKKIVKSKGLLSEFLLKLLCIFFVKKPAACSADDIILGDIGVIEKKIYKATDNKIKIHIGVYYLKEDEIDLRLAGNYANQALEHVVNEKSETIKFYDENGNIYDVVYH